jgi:hypothetical protein
VWLPLRLIEFLNFKRERMENKKERGGGNGSEPAAAPAKNRVATFFSTPVNRVMLRSNSGNETYDVAEYL